MAIHNECYNFALGFDKEIIQFSIFFYSHFFILPVFLFLIVCHIKVTFWKNHIMRLSDAVIHMTHALQICRESSINKNSLNK